MKFKSQVFSMTSGSIAGQVFSHNKGGLYTRARTIPTNPNTAAQQAVRGAVKFLTTYWANTLTAAQRTAWGTYATNVPLPNTLGDSRPIPPMSMFVRCNSPRYQALGAAGVIAAGPTIYSLATFTQPVLSKPAAVWSMAFTNTDTWATITGGLLLVYLSTTQNVTINFFKGPFKFVGSVVGGTTPPTSPNTALFTGLPAPAAGQHYFARYRCSNSDGRLSSSYIQNIQL